MQAERREQSESENPHRVDLGRAGAVRATAAELADTLYIKVCCDSQHIGWTAAWSQPLRLLQASARPDAARIPADRQTLRNAAVFKRPMYGRPIGPPRALNNAVDELFKREFDPCRTQPRPLLPHRRAF
jgi:hypothetical protein